MCHDYSWVIILVGDLPSVPVVVNILLGRQAENFVDLFIPAKRHHTIGLNNTYFSTIL